MSETGTRLITGTDFVTQPVRNYDAAAKFYGERTGRLLTAAAPAPAAGWP
jgi:hypothetical protein